MSVASPSPSSLIEHSWFEGQPRPEGYDIAGKPIAVFRIALTDDWFDEGQVQLRKASPSSAGSIRPFVLFSFVTLCSGTFLLLNGRLSFEWAAIAALATSILGLGPILAVAYGILWYVRRVSLQYLHRVRGESGIGLVSLYREGVCLAAENVTTIARWHQRCEAWSVAGGFLVKFASGITNWLPADSLVEGDVAQVTELLRVNIATFKNLSTN